MMIEVFADCSFRHRKGRCTYTFFDTKYKIFYATRDYHKIYTADSATGEFKAALAAIRHVEKLFYNKDDTDFIIYGDDITNIRILQENNMLLLMNRPDQYKYLAVMIMTIANDLKKRGANIKFKFANRKSHLIMRYVDNISYDHSKGRLRKESVVGDEVEHNGIVLSYF